MKHFQIFGESLLNSLISALNLPLWLSRWLTAPVEMASTTCGAGQWCAAPVDFPQTNPATALCLQLPAPTAAVASLRVYCHTPMCSALAHLARWALQHRQMIHDCI